MSIDLINMRKNLKNKIKILFIIPPIKKIDEKYSSSPKKNIKFPSLGVAKLIGFLKLNGYFNLNSIDLRYKNNFIEKNITKKAIDKLINEYNPDLISFSIMFSNQLDSAENIARQIKKINKKILILFGGSALIDIFKDIMNKPTSINFLDGMVMGGGENPLLKFIDAIEKNKDLNLVPNLIYKNNLKRKYFINEKSFNRDKKHIKIMPIFNSADLNDMIPIEVSIGCYWGKCSFCSCSKDCLINNYKIISFKKIVNQINKLKKKHGRKLFVFYDESIPPKYLQDFSREIIKRKIDINWRTSLCLDPILLRDPYIIKDMKASGCQSISFGIESFSDPVLKSMRKIHNSKTAIEIIKRFKEYGIKVYLNIIINFPTETKKDTLKTINFLINYTNLYEKATISLFYLYKNSYIFKYPKEFGIKKIFPSKSSIYNYKSLSGLSRKEIKEVIFLINKKVGSKASFNFDTSKYLND